MTMLSKAESGIKQKPHFTLLYSEPGVGKSTWASKSPKPIFLCSEDGTDQLDVTRVKIHSFTEFIQILNELRDSQHEFKTVVLDTIDHFEQIVFDKVAKDKGKSSIEDIGYAKGYIYALDEWRKIADLLEELRNTKGMNVLILGHSVIKAHNDPQLDAPFDTYKIKMHEKGMEFWRDRVNDVLFATYKSFLEEKDSGKNKAYSDGSRVVYTEKRPSFIAKNRHNLPFQMPLNWDDYETACKNSKPKDPAQMIDFITKNLSFLPEEIRDKATKHFEANKTNPVILAQIEDRIKTIISTKTA